MASASESLGMLTQAPLLTNLMTLSSASDQTGMATTSFLYLMASLRPLVPPCPKKRTVLLWLRMEAWGKKSRARTLLGRISWGN